MRVLQKFEKITFCSSAARACKVKGTSEFTLSLALIFQQVELRSESAGVIVGPDYESTVKNILQWQGTQHSSTAQQWTGEIKSHARCKEISYWICFGKLFDDVAHGRRLNLNNWRPQIMKYEMRVQGLSLSRRPSKTVTAKSQLIYTHCTRRYNSPIYKKTRISSSNPYIFGLVFKHGIEFF